MLSDDEDDNGAGMASLFGSLVGIDRIHSLSIHLSVDTFTAMLQHIEALTLGRSH